MKKQLKAAKAHSFSEIRVRDVIFNPYRKESYAETETQLESAELVCTIPRCTLWQDCSLKPAKTGTGCIYKIKAEYAWFCMGDWNKDLFWSDSKQNEYPVFAYFEKNVWQWLEPGIKDGILEDLGSIKADRIAQYALSPGKVTNADAYAGKEIKDMKIIPRELFRDVSDNVYLFVRTKGSKAPDIKCCLFPKNGKFFWDLPAAEAIYQDELFLKPRILPGSVKERKPDDSLEDVEGRFFWKPLRIMPIKDYPRRRLPVFIHKNCLVRSCLFIDSDKNIYKGTDIEIRVYRRREKDPGRSISAFVWRSGNNNDLVKHEYLPEDYYARYSYLTDSVSLASIYKTTADLRIISPENAARFLARSLAQQPKGKRSLSVEGVIERLMGGSLYEIMKAEDKLQDDYLSYYFRTLLAINNSYLFYDSPVTYKTVQDADGPEAVLDALFYIRDVLGIPEGSNGCREAGKLLHKVFAAINEAGIGIDYMTSNLEMLYMDSNSMEKRLYNGKFTGLLYNGSYTEMWKDIYSGKISEEIYERRKRCEEISDEEEKKQIFDVQTNVLARGFVSESDSDRLTLLEITSKSDDYLYRGDENALRNTAPYGLNVNHTYIKRRNLNVWDAVMKNYDDAFLMRYVYDPVRRYNKNVLCGRTPRTSAKGYINRAGMFETYLGGSVESAPGISSTVSLYGGTPSHGVKKLTMDNWRMYPNKATILTSLIEDINELRASKQSSGNKTQAFVCHPDFFCKKAMENDELREEAGRLYSDRGMLEAAFLQYYRELLYHTCLNTPEKIYFYFNDSEKETNETDPSLFYTSCYEKVQNILAAVNDLTGGGNLRAVESCMAPETDPYLISGAQIGNKRIWRVSWDIFGREEIRQEACGSTYIVSVGKKTLRFRKGKKLTDVVKHTGIPESGCWIKTPRTVYPELVTADNYYRENAALLVREDINRKVPDGLLYTDKTGNQYLSDRTFKTYSLFGEAPNRLVCSLKFHVTGRPAGKIRLLPHGDGIAIPAPVIEGSETEDEGVLIDLCPDGRSGENEKTGRYALEYNKTYEVKSILTVRDTEDSDQSIRTVNYELYSETGEGSSELLGRADNEIETPKNPHAYLISYLNILIPVAQKGWDEVVTEEFRVYFDKPYEKIEIFRERDGVNVGRVNRSVKGYENVQPNIGFDTVTGDILVGKFSWLNASNSRAFYRIRYRVDGVLRTFGKNNVFPMDGRVQLPGAKVRIPGRPSSGIQKMFGKMSAFPKSGVFSVGANTEGYILIDLPPTGSEASTVTLTVEKYELRFRKRHASQGKPLYRQLWRVTRKIAAEVSVPLLQ